MTFKNILENREMYVNGNYRMTVADGKEKLTNVRDDDIFGGSDGKTKVLVYIDNSSLLSYKSIYPILKPSNMYKLAMELSESDDNYVVLSTNPRSEIIDRSRYVENADLILNGRKDDKHLEDLLRDNKNYIKNPNNIRFGKGASYGVPSDAEV